LSSLLEILYPDPNPDVFTLDSFKFVSKLHGLNETAVSHIEQSQRVNRALDNYKLMGLNEFHIGLIYLYCGEVHAAEKQFELARRQWMFVNEPASLCLAYLACGFAQHMTFHYESAMSSYRKAWQNLDRIRFTPPSNRSGLFREKIEKYLTDAQAELRRRMWPDPGSEEDPEQPPTEEPSPPEAEEEQTEAAPEEIKEDETGEQGETPVSEEKIPLPRWSNLSDDPMPIDGHTKQDGRYRWYEVEKRLEDDFIPQIHLGDWLLVYTEPEQSDLSPTNEEPVVIVSEKESDSTIRLKSHPSDQNGPRRIYLQTVTVEEGPFNRDIETGEVRPQFERVLRDLNILGVVVGLWRPTAQVVNQ